MISHHYVWLSGCFGPEIFHQTGEFHPSGRLNIPLLSPTQPKGHSSVGWGGRGAAPSAAQAGTGPWQAHRAALKYLAPSSVHALMLLMWIIRETCKHIHLQAQNNEAFSAALGFFPIFCAIPLHSSLLLGQTSKSEKQFIYHGEKIRFV